VVKDPVCSMNVDPTKAAAQSQHNGKTYYFCSQSCKQKFDQQPAQFEEKS
jgi:YHS domain-containing protein